MEMRGNPGWFRFLGNVEMWRREVYLVSYMLGFHCLLATAVDGVHTSFMYEGLLEVKEVILFVGLSHEFPGVTSYTTQLGLRSS